MKKLLLLIYLFSISYLGFSQNETAYKKNKYFITMYNLHDKNFDLTKTMLEKITDATSVEFNKTDSSFVILTYRILDKNVVSGKMLKNYFPIKSFIKEGEQPEPFPSLINTSNPEQDALIYEEKKNNWVKKYPKEYKKMVETNAK